METTLDLNRWREKPRGIWFRRWTIVSAGLRHLLSLRLFRIQLVLAWTAGFLIAAFVFVFNQSVASGGWLETLTASWNARLHSVASALGALIILYPDVCIRGIYTILFWLQSYLGLWLSLVSLTLIIPRLVARDRAGNALTIYLARPLTSVDYLIGKFGVVVGTLALVWTGPLLAGWLVSLLVAPGKDFLIYSFEPLCRALAFNLLALFTLSPLALGISALFRTSRNTVALWVALWLVAGFIALDGHMPNWIRRASFTHNLSEVRQDVLRVDDVLTDAGTKLPLMDRQFATRLNKAGQIAEATDFNGALLGLGLIAAGSSIVFFRKLRPE